MNEGVIRALQERLVRDRDALNRVLQSFGIVDPLHASEWPFRLIFEWFPDTPVRMLKDVFEALQLYDLVEMFEFKSTKPPRSLQLAKTLDEIKKLNGVADLPTTYHSCGAVLIIADDENASYASRIKTLFTDLDDKSDVTEVIQRTFELRYKPRDMSTHLMLLKKEINEMILEINRFGNLSEGETQSQFRVSQIIVRAIYAVQQFKLSIQLEGRELNDYIDMILRSLNNRLKNPSEGTTEARETAELNFFLKSMMFNIEMIQRNLRQRSHEWFFKEKEKEEQNFEENVSAVINRWIHRQGKYK